MLKGLQAKVILLLSLFVLVLNYSDWLALQGNLFDKVY
ncbi:hypothetical protein MGSAQ_000809 [marine sediment metagenome]|uniref:Uncharacterized protein n=1 Tax=marine sediment metagenome TaxID=412755 RepID=A0A1B6NW61_9ZZZZ